jgi:carbon storage regulator
LINYDTRTDELARREHIMLVLSRRVGEEIVIADEIRVAIIGVKGQRVRLGITAPRSVPVTRSELLSQNPDGARLQANGRPGT